ncbi:MAG TPA: diacylglycerol kinase family protein [Rhodothermales bacterium]|nr:diacylglycerol kinase family protein [Rhodothermales bacterium]
MKVAVLVNHRSGRAARTDVAAGRLHSAFQQRGIDANVKLLNRSDLLQEVRVAVASNAEAIVVGGGDGTISAAARVLVRTDIPLGVLPLGTSNHFALDLEIPIDIEGAIRVIADGHTRSLGVAEVNGHVFVNNSALGFYPEVVRTRHAIREWLPLNKRLLRAAAAIAAFPRLPRLNLWLKAGERTYTHTTSMVFIGTNAYKLNAFEFGACPRTEGGRLFVYLVPCPGHRCFLRVLATALFRDVAEGGYLKRFVEPEVQIDAHHGKLTVFADGEIVPLTPPLTYRSLPAALRVFTPPATS